MQTTSRPVAARATRIASIVASVPELANRSISRLNRRQISSPKATADSVVTAKWVPRLAASWIASTIRGCAWPTTMAPKPQWKSRYSLPSWSQMWLPFPWVT